MFIGLEKALFGNISKGAQDPAGNDYTVIGKYFHNMHVYAHYTQNEKNSHFHPIAACLHAAVMGMMCSIMARLVSQILPKTFRYSFRVVCEGGAWIYAASVIYTAAQGWSAITHGAKLSGGKPTASMD